jgi:N-dimethylarginine dimethylaminohydrolase
MEQKFPILMCRPDHFGVTYSINPWMDPAAWAHEAQKFAATSKLEWRALNRMLKKLGAAVQLVPPAAGLPDLVFTANAAVVMDRKALVARFRHPERQREEALFERAFQKLKAAGVIDVIEHLPDGIRLEGAGDCVWDKVRGHFWMGYGPRSDKAAKARVEAAFGVEAVALELVDPRFYHMDTAIAPLSGGEVMYIPSAFNAAGRAEIARRVPAEKRIEVAEEDAVLLACNAVNLGRDIVLSRCSDAMRKNLEGRGYRVHSVPLTSFALSGGSAFCLTLRLDHRSNAARDEAMRAAG